MDTTSSAVTDATANSSGYIPAHDPAPMVLASFEGKAVAFFEWRGKRACLMADFGRGLGYARDGKALAQMFTKDWADEAKRGHHYDVVQGAADMAELRAVLGDDMGIMSSSSARAAILYEPGFHLACIKTEKPVGIRCRAWLTEEVMPQIARTGQYVAPPAPALMATSEEVSRLSDRLARVELALEGLSALPGAFERAIDKAFSRVAGLLGQKPVEAREAIGESGAQFIADELDAFAKLMVRSGSSKSKRSWRARGEHELRSAADFHGTGRRWPDLPLEVFNAKVKMRLRELTRFAEAVLAGSVSEDEIVKPVPVKPATTIPMEEYLSARGLGPWVAVPPTSIN